MAADQQRGLGIVQGPSKIARRSSPRRMRLYKAVVEPAASVIGDKRILVVADGALNYIPFEALVTATGVLILRRCIIWSRQTRSFTRLQRR